MNSLSFVNKYLLRRDTTFYPQGAENNYIVGYKKLPDIKHRGHKEVKVL